MEEEWYALHCDPRRDRCVQDLIDLASFEAFNPRVPKTRKRDGDKPLFPGYVFVRLDLGRGDWLELQYLPGIRHLVHIGGGPCPVDGSILEAIRERLARGMTAAPVFRPGDRIRVTSGAFADLEGVFSEKLSGAERVAILINMMERHVRIELDVDNLERITRHPGGASRPNRLFARRGKLSIVGAAAPSA